MISDLWGRLGTACKTYLVFLGLGEWDARLRVWVWGFLGSGVRD